MNLLVEVHQLLRRLEADLDLPMPKRMEARDYGWLVLRTLLADGVPPEDFAKVPKLAPDTVIRRLRRADLRLPRPVSRHLLPER